MRAVELLRKVINISFNDYYNSLSNHIYKILDLSHLISSNKIKMLLAMIKITITNTTKNIIQNGWRS